jgi:putative ABC transport system substrate-binding protein
MPFDQLHRREFISLLGGASAWPLPASAQQATKAPTVGFLFPGPRAGMLARVEAMLNGLHAADYRASPQVELVLRASDGDPTRIAPLVAEIVKSKVDVILATGPEVPQAFRSATTTIPIIAVDFESDPVGSGLVDSIARPGRNITGVFFDFLSFTAKWIELLKEINPQLSRLAVLWDVGTGSMQMKAIRQAAELLAVQIDVLEVRTRSDFEEAFVSATQRGADALLMLSSAVISTNAQLLADFAVRYKLPAITLYPDFARAGGLLAYGPNLLDAYRQAGVMIGKVLKGAKPAELPIEVPTRFPLVLNLRTAKTLGLSIPTGVLLRADEVIE